MTISMIRRHGFAMSRKEDARFLLGREYATS